LLGSEDPALTLRCSVTRGVRHVTVQLRLVASHAPQDAGNRGLMWVGTHRNPGKVPLRHGRFRESLGQGLRDPLQRLSGHPLRRNAPANEPDAGVGVVPLTPVFRVGALRRTEVARRALIGSVMSRARGRATELRHQRSEDASQSPAADYRRVLSDELALHFAGTAPVGSDRKPAIIPVFASTHLADVR
jgi:hypothetical protein